MQQLSIHHELDLSAGISVDALLMTADPEMAEIDWPRDLTGDRTAWPKPAEPTPPTPDQLPRSPPSNTVSLPLNNLRDNAWRAQRKLDPFWCSIRCACPSVAQGEAQVTTDSTSLSIDLEEVEALGSLAFRIAEECKSGYASLVTDMRSTIDNWSGNNASAFNSAWDEFHEGADQVWDALFELAERLGVTTATLQATDQSSAGSLSSLDLP